MFSLDWFSRDYATARQRFREALGRCGWTCESHSIGLTGPDGEDLTIDVGCSPAGDSQQTLVVSSGVHGVEGFFGSAVQLGLLEQWGDRTPPIRFVLLHGLNPFGFASLRRFDENNVDPNRNFLLDGELYEGSPPHYADLDSLLNPRRPPSAVEAFLLNALPAIVRYGMPALRQAITAGQYEFPKGTYGPIRVVAGLRAENQAHHWGSPTAASTSRAKKRLKELFCPSDVKWRKSVLDQSLALVSRAVEGLQQ